MSNMQSRKLLVAVLTVTVITVGLSQVMISRAVGATLDTDKDEISLGQDLTIKLVEPDANFNSRSIDRIPFNVILLTTDKFDKMPLDEVLEIVAQKAASQGKSAIRTSHSSLMETGFNTGIFEVTLESINDLLVDRNEDIRLIYFDNTASGGGSPTRIEKIVHVVTASISVAFDKNEYSPFDKIVVKLSAQMFNINRSKIDTINTPTESKVAITTSSGKSYFPVMVETGPNTGFFICKIQLTPNQEDEQGDLVVTSGERIKVTVVILSGYQVTDYAVVSTTLGNISFDEPEYSVGDTVKIIVTDGDENRDPSMIDTIQVKVWSSTDVDGITLTLQELAIYSGIFEGMLTLSTEGSDDTRLLVSNIDILVAKYLDQMLPSLTKSTITKDLFATARVGIPVNTDILVSQPSIFDKNGKKLENIKVGKLIAVQSSLTNAKLGQQKFAYIVSIKDAEGFTSQLSFVTAILEPFQSFKVGTSWIPELTGKYTIQVFTWNSIAEPSVFSPVKRITAAVQE
ncbi:MAG: hypothetical protein ACE5J2_04615 [Nitrososphaerales archaeon]